MPEIKICGITKPEETAYLNEAGVAYAGFVFFEKSKRNVTIGQAKRLMELLDAGIKKVAVTVSPKRSLIEQIEQAGFDLLQVHGEWQEEEFTDCRLPIWRAVNISDIREAEARLDAEHAFENPTIVGFVADGASYGGGKTFSWQEAEEKSGILRKMKKKSFVLAGGLQPGNVAEGIQIFEPDIVDVSSGVEGTKGKSKEKIEEFVREVRKHG